MLILSNCLTDKADEGCLKVANSLIKRLKQAEPNTTVVSFERRSPLTDVHLKLNKLMLNRSLFSLIWKHREPVLYIPFPAKTISMAVRTFLLSCMSGKKVGILMTMTGTFDPIGKLLMKISGTHVFALCRESADYYAGIVGDHRVTYLKTGVDTLRFFPVSRDRSRELKMKYGLDPDKKTVLHVGHLKSGRNIAHLMKLDPQYQILLVVSTLTKEDQDQALRTQLRECANVTILDTFIPDIQEVYQLADIYFFPVLDKSHCIDIPLSVMEAASCGKPVVTTDFGELKEFTNANGFFFISSFDADVLNELVGRAIKTGPEAVREAVLDYDWNHAVACLSNWNDTI